MQRIKIENEKINGHITELKLAAIHAQMNPHFIFNVLNNIKYFLVVDKKKEAEILVDDFSLLMRKFLNYNDNFFTTIKEEIEFIKLYVSIEKSRLNHSFEFNCSVKEDLMNKIIPTMLIQPFIENAIKHGIAHSEKKCDLNLNINNEGDLILIAIEDNGIGISASKKITKLNTVHNSKGIKLVEDKIENLKLKYNVFVNLSIIDNTLNDKKGTKVKLKILTENENELRNH
jgi:sensor histidine kinase YesM